MGEVADLRRDSIGNVRFALEDGAGRMTCVLWAQDARGDFDGLANGLRVTALARVDLFARDGRVYANVRAIQLEGEGAARRRLERTRERLYRDGLLDSRRKRPIPRYPRGVGVITSRTGAALQDILAVARRRHPAIPVFVVPATMQGDDAPRSIIQALGLVQRAGMCDIAILARGGGSAADLSAFNDEGLARAIASCRLPVITAIGHETDKLLADDVADAHVGTPSMAAERSLPERIVLERDLTHLSERMRSVLHSRATRAEDRLAIARGALMQRLTSRLQRQIAHLERFEVQMSRIVDARIQRNQTRLERHAETMTRAVDDRISRERARIKALRDTLSALDPMSILSRGYAVITDEDGQVVSNANDARRARRLVIRMHDGELMVMVSDAKRPLDVQTFISEE
jgi:exodeoxyribonuclease VII large subunit